MIGILIGRQWRQPPAPGRKGTCNMQPAHAIRSFQDPHPISICIVAWSCSYELSVLKARATRRIVCPPPSETATPGTDRAKLWRGGSIQVVSGAWSFSYSKWIRPQGLMMHY